MSGMPPEHDQYHRLVQVLQYVQENLAEPLSLEGLAELAHYSPQHFRRLFRGLMGEGVYQHVRRLRLERAAGYLLIKDENLHDLARRVGFESREAFTRAFIAAFGCAPTRFRQRLRRRKHLGSQLPAATGVHDRYAAEGTNGFHRSLEGFQPLADRSGELEVRIKELPAITLACVRHVGDPAQAYRAWLKLLAWGWRRGLLSAQPIYFGLNYDDEEVTPLEQMRYDAAILVDGSFRGDGSVYRMDLLGGWYAIARAEGTLERLTDLWDVFVYHWLPRSGHELRLHMGFDRYHPPADIVRRPIRAVWRYRRHIVSDMHIPIQAPAAPIKK